MQKNEDLASVSISSPLGPVDLYMAALCFFFTRKVTYCTFETCGSGGSSMGHVEVFFALLP